MPIISPGHWFSKTPSPPPKPPADYIQEKRIQRHNSADNPILQLEHRLEPALRTRNQRPAITPAKMAVLLFRLKGVPRYVAERPLGSKLRTATGAGFPPRFPPPRHIARIANPVGRALGLELFATIRTFCHGPSIPPGRPGRIPTGRLTPHLSRKDRCAPPMISPGGPFSKAPSPLPNGHPTLDFTTHHYFLGLERPDGL